MEYFLVSFFLIQYVRSALSTKTQLPEWEKKLLIARHISTALVAMTFINSEFKITPLLWHVFMLGLMWILYTKDEFRAIRNVIMSVIPFVVIAMFNDFFEYFTPGFYERYGAYLSNGKTFAFFLAFGIWAYAQKQQKVLIKEREERALEEKEARAQKESLEYLVAERTYELTLQKEELQKTIEELKSTQNQLIQSEKMASLGELTAGIAHEIQNPLNFVNNFSEVSVELCDELQEEIDKSELPASEKDYIKEIIGDLSQNQQKITHHGKRADSIVKGMLQHSRVSSGEKEPTDINALADEYMRLAYHGLRAKDKEFNAALITDLDPTVGTVNVVAQDLGRVFLNLFTNAFYAVSEKKKKRAAEGDTTFKPEVKISTRKFGGQLFVRVEDNGTGMPESVKAKIFQPFFTTKPTGQGTGLGLSMSYDIVTNQHGGVLDVDSTPGERTEFKITLPVEDAAKTA